jgi:Flp pilus assembly protein TadG
MQRIVTRPQLATRRLRRLGAILSMELVLVIPIFLLILFSIVEFSMLASARTQVTDAARHGSRLLCISDRSHDDIQQEVRRFLGRQLSEKAVVDINDNGHPGETVNVRIRIPMRSASPDLLWMTGFSVRDRYLRAEAPMAREHDVATTRIDQL